MTFVDDALRDSRVDRARPKAVFRATCAVILGIVCSMPSHAAEAHDLSRVIRIDIPAQPLSGALLQLARQAHMPIMFSTTLTRRLSAPEVHGEFTEHEALHDLLRHSGLGFIQQGGTVKIVPLKDSAKAAHHSSQSHSARPHRPIQAIALQEVVVTGSHIRGGPPPSAPIITITRRDIEESGYQSVEQVMAALPENFASVGSGQAYDLAAENDSGNISNGAAVDLDGLGFDSTLVLVNGHRLAPSGTRGAFTDISVIPISAIKRIDVLTGGASAIYGADAIGGVVNYVLRSHEKGAETALEYGSVTEGGLKDYRASQSAGMSWASGNLFAAYEFHKRTALSAGDRNFSSSAGPYSLLPDSTQNNFYVTATQNIGAKASLEGDLFYEQRRTHNAFPYSGILVGSDAHSREYSAGIEAARALGTQWHGHMRLRYGESRDSLDDVFGTEQGRSRLLTASAGADGPILRLRSGVARGAIGAEVRRESFSSRYTGVFASENNLGEKRTVDAVYVESRIPLWAGRQDSRLGPLLSADLAARYEHYSDFGSSLNPMAGLAWQPARGLRFRGTVSSSFRAPNFYELYGASQAELFNSPYPGSQGNTEAVLVRVGANPDLKPERSTEWTVGTDIEPEGTGMHVKLTYFHVHFKDRIASPDIPLLSALDQGRIFAPYIQWNPSLTELEASAGPAADYYNITEYPGFGPTRTLSEAVAIADNRLQNVGVTNVSGIDAGISQAGEWSRATYRLSAQTTYLLRYENIFVPGAMPVSVLSTFQNPVNFRARLTAGLSLERVSGNAALNYTNHYSDTTQGTPVRVASWTTVDIQLAYRIPVNRSYGGLTASLSCQNCLNRSPPSLRTTTYPLGYDPANANPLGRFVSLTLRKKW